MKSSRDTDSLTNREPVQPLRIQLNQPATIRCMSPTQYFEKQADGTFRIREIAADSPDVPRYLLTFVAKPADNAALNLLVTCRSEIATVLSREPIPGVDLEVGRPRLSVRQDEIKLAMRVGEWAALLLRAPKENDYSILALFKIALVGVASPALAADSPPPFARGPPTEAGIVERLRSARLAPS